MASPENSSDISRKINESSCEYAGFVDKDEAWAETPYHDRESPGNDILDLELTQKFFHMIQSYNVSEELEISDHYIIRFKVLYIIYGKYVENSKLQNIHFNSENIPCS